ncbi:MAG: formate dehydrogenase accessory sulfurtransferase FdhD [Acidimicrobiia bacterium]|nr:formate dehydrogenase accessory sulfurtransferase FdhD [Acidimicrobiia bacterium]
MSVPDEAVTRRPAVRDAPFEDAVVVEEPIEIRLGGVALAVLMRTPGYDEDLVRGFALTEGIVLRPAEIDRVVDLGEGRFEIDLAEGVTVDPERFRRNLYATSSCGVCGKASIDAVRVAARRPPPGPSVSQVLLARCAEALAEHQPTFALTGGLHAAAAFDADGGLVAVREDVGRHNAVDKLVGHLAPSAWPVDPPVLVVSGRVSFEIVQKAAVAGIAVVAGVSAVSSLAIDLAAELGLSIAGFTRDGACTVYVDGGRITTP